jgi:hypothetical protein
VGRILEAGNSAKAITANESGPACLSGCGVEERNATHQGGDKKGVALFFPVTVRGMRLAQ